MEKEIIIWTHMDQTQHIRTVHPVDSHAETKTMRHARTTRQRTTHMRSGNAASLSMGAQLGEPGGGGVLLLRGLKVMIGRL